jgi:hypothetical protein
MKECCMGIWGDFTGENIGIKVVEVTAVVVFFTLDFSFITILREGEELAKIYLGGFLTSFLLDILLFVG